MNNEQKQRAIAALTKWWAADSNKAVLSTGYEMAGVLQELIDAPEPEQPNQSEQHLEMVNPPTLIDERIFKLFLEKAVDKGTAGIYDFARAIEREILGGSEK